ISSAASDRSPSVICLSPTVAITVLGSGGVGAAGASAEGAAGASAAGAASCANAAGDSASAVVTSRPPARVLRAERNPFGVEFVIGEILLGTAQGPRLAQRPRGVA